MTPSWTTSSRSPSCSPPSRASRSPNRRARSRSRQPMCCGSPRKRAAPMATSFPRHGRTAASSSPRSRSASSRRSRRGISRRRCCRARSRRRWPPAARRSIKPASQTPYSGLAWGVLCEEVGFPKGAVNVVTGSAAEIGDEICSNWLVRKLTFTGSTEVGKMLMAKCAASVKKVSMELGGNAPFIVFDDADIDRAVEGAMVAKYRNSGQTCVCTNRFFVQDGIYDAFVEKLAAATPQAEGRSRPRGRHPAGAADRREGGREGRGADRRRQGQGRQDRHRRQAPCARRLVLRADRDRRGEARHALHEGRDLWAGRAGVPLQGRSRGDRGLPTTPNSASPAISTPAISAARSASWKA